jgi:HTH-type transcriptional regulator/antitoxin MqsA
MTTTIQCVLCGGIARGVKEKREIRIGNRVASVDDEFMRCESCGEEFYIADQMQQAQERAGNIIRAEEGLLASRDIRRIRDRYDLTQAELERLLGVGPKTVVRWERGTVFQNSATDTLLRLVDALPEVAALLGQWRGVHIGLFYGASVTSYAKRDVAPKKVAEGSKVIPFPKAPRGRGKKLRALVREMSTAQEDEPQGEETG